MSELITLTQAAGILSISMPTLYSRIKKSKVQLVKVGHRSFIEQTDLKALLSFDVMQALEALKDNRIFATNALILREIIKEEVSTATLTPQIEQLNLR